MAGGKRWATSGESTAAFVTTQYRFSQHNRGISQKFSSPAALDLKNTNVRLLYRDDCMQYHACAFVIIKINQDGTTGTNKLGTDSKWTINLSIIAGY